jgi:hypothetical protein
MNSIPSILQSLGAKKTEAGVLFRPQINSLILTGSLGQLRQCPRVLLVRRLRSSLKALAFTRLRQNLLLRLRRRAHIDLQYSTFRLFHHRKLRPANQFSQNPLARHSVFVIRSTAHSNFSLPFIFHHSLFPRSFPLRPPPSLAILPVIDVL